MIKDDSIQEVRDQVNIYDVVSAKVQLRKTGISYQGKCPFHDEKTPSFNVFPKTNTYKCFGCGAGGDAIKFVMHTESRSFYEAVEALAERLNIQLLEDQQAIEEAEGKKVKKAALLQLTDWAQRMYEKKLHSLPPDAEAYTYLQGRGYTTERMRKWSLGYAPADDRRYLTEAVINKGKYDEGLESGLMVTKEGRNYDFLQNRITIPLHDHLGILVGIAGRELPAPDGSKSKVKYLNPKESIIYSKSRLWYGLWLAAKDIKEKKFAYVVEGYTDTHAMHDAGMINTIASCGTEIDDKLMLLLRRFTNHVVLCYDGDAAGIKKMMKKIDDFLRHGFRIDVIPLPDNNDPDEYIRTVEIEEVPEEVMEEEIN